jgi:RES domain-containing protein
MIYCASSLALAALEVLVHLPPAMRRKGAIPPLVAVGLDMPDALVGDPSLSATLAEDESRAIGDDWLRVRSSLGLIVPSRVIPLERNIVLNPFHPNTADVSVTRTEPFEFDDRLTY